MALICLRNAKVARKTLNWTRATPANGALADSTSLMGYAGADGQRIEGASVSDLVRAIDPALDDEMKARLDSTLAAMEVMRERAKNVETYDQMIAQGNAEGNAVIQTIVDQLVAQTRTIERVIAALGLAGVQIEGSDSLDSPASVFQ